MGLNNCKHDFRKGMFMCNRNDKKFDVAEAICCIKCGKQQKIIKWVTHSNE